MKITIDVIITEMIDTIQIFIHIILYIINKIVYFFCVILFGVNNMN